MEIVDFFGLFSGTLKDLGLAGLVIAAQFIGLVFMWKALGRCHERQTELVDQVIRMSQETNTMIERITGR